MAKVSIEGVTVKHGDSTTIPLLDLEVDDGEFVVVIGPSGSGKTTILRIVAGLERPVNGVIRFDGVNVVDLPPAKRDVSMVFQGDSLIPFKSAKENVAFPLEVHRVERGEIDDRVMAETRALGIEKMLDRLPKQLSAGHQQLVQAARSLVRRPSVLLMDEPLARMDATNRTMMRTEIRTLQQGYEVTTIYATNDHEEAMILADRIIVIDGGRIRQIGTPEDVYRRPSDTFVAEFVGSPAMSLIPGRIDELEVHTGAGSFPLSRSVPAQDVVVGIRPEDWDFDTSGVEGSVESFENHGAYGYARVSIGSELVLVRMDHQPSVGETVVAWPRRLHFFSPSGRAIAHH